MGSQPIERLPWLYLCSLVAAACTPAPPPGFANEGVTPRPVPASDGSVAIAVDSTADAAADAANDSSIADAAPDAAIAESANDSAADAAVCTEPKEEHLLPAAPAEWTQCGKDSHCVIVAASCCSCGPMPAENARAVNKVVASYRNPYCTPGTGCPACASFRNPSLSAVCVKGHCRVRETYDPCSNR